MESPGTVEDTDMRDRVQAPIDRLPNELTLEIWSYNISHRNTWRIVPFIVDMSWVSRRWRAVALNAPELWSDIYLSFWNRKVGVVEAQLQRSKDLLLSITVDLNFKRPPSKRAHLLPTCVSELRQIMPLLRAQLPRWRSLDVTIHSWTLNGNPSGHNQAYYDIILRPLSQAAAPKLESLSVQYVCDLNNVLIFDGGMPSLSSLTLCRSIDIGLCHLARVNSLALHDSLGRIPLGEFHRIVDACPSLRHLSLNGACVHFPPGYLELPVLELPGLITLSLTAVPLFNDWITRRKQGILHSLSLPNLRTLYLCACPLDILPHSSTSPYPSLEKLHVAVDENGTRSVRRPGFRKILSRFPSINILSSDSDSLLQALVWDKGAPDAVCPSLHTLIWTSASAIDNSADLLRVARRRRLKAGHPLVELHVTHPAYRSMAPSVLKQLREVVKLQIRN
ncbi:hypothetical protein OE88DRAFT_1737048 [Heliocybe sulcata]|uniref:Uncharacterized protein n=1 Tax=Heliocybe sulcata TaxID=5364 RepID=A0A5C3MZ18_9AGAM|nr:hypothetical protein OE88DRAFT_1737048 [Heliocybe sulcata]